MSQTAIETLKSLKKTKVLFNEEGQPEFALIPLRKLRSQSKTVSQILQESSQAFKQRGITQEELFAELGVVRRELYQKYYGKKANNSSGF